MNYFFYIFLFFGSCQALSAQTVERKIIVANDRFYYTTIDEEFQIATLHTGNISETLKSESRLALPAGRNYNDPINPFSWDLSNNLFYANNSLVHPMNDKNEALKRFPISSLQEWSSKITVMDMLMKSIDQNMFTYNDPYQFIINRSKTLNNFFYDGIALSDSSYYMAIANNSELTIWNYNGKKWEHGSIQLLAVDGYFTLFSFNKQVYMVLNSGLVYSVSKDAVAVVPDKTLGQSLADGFIVDNRDEKTIAFIKNDQLDQHTPLDKLIKKKSIKIF